MVFFLVTVLLANLVFPALVTGQANSFFSLGPRISVWFSTPPQDPRLGTQDWYELLAVHEMRRIAQYDKLDYGFTRVAGQLYGA